MAEKKTTNPIKTAPKADVFVSSVEKKSDPLINTPNYRDKKQFPAYLENKFSKMLKDPSKEDIEALADSVSAKTGADKDEILKVVSRLTQFSNYSQLPEMEHSFTNMHVGKLNGCYLSYKSADRGNVDINNVLQYLHDSKWQFDFMLGYNSILFLDNNTLSYIEKEKNDPKSNLFEKLCADAKQKKLKIAIVDGWNAKVDGFDVSHTMFGSPLSLEDAITRIIEEKQKTNKSLDDILNGDIIERAKKVFGNNTKINIIKNKQANKATPENIARVMKSKYPNKDVIEATIHTIVNKQAVECEFTKGEKQRAYYLLSKYFDKMLFCNSQETITEALKNKYREIEKIVTKKGKTMDDVIYVIPCGRKSFDLISYHYAKANNIKPEKFINYNGIDTPDIDLSGKTLVILDDIVGSGQSLTLSAFSYDDFTQSDYIDEKTDIIFAPLSTLRKGLKNINHTIALYGRKDKDCVLPTKVVNAEKFFSTLDTKDQNLLIKVLGYSGFEEGNACTAMPYMIPDNDTYASGLLLGHMLHDQRGNKRCDWWIEYSPVIEERVMNENK